MESSWHFWPRIVVVLYTLSFLCCGVTAGPVGVCYGRDGDNLPTPLQSVALLQQLGVSSARIFDADSGVILAFADSGIDLSITVANGDLPAIAFAQTAANQWVTTNVLPYYPATNISSICVGSEVVFSDNGNTSLYLVPAMQNIYSALRTNNLATSIQVTTSNAMNILTVSYPPSSGTFNPVYVPTVIVPLLTFLAQTRSPFLLNSYPYYAYVDDPNGISLSYALFSSSNAVVVDSGNNLQYTNLLDAQIDAVFAAMKALNFTGIQIVVAETGWPSRGDSNETAASVVNAQTYNQNLINHIVGGGGTPLMSGVTFQTYVFSLYNEDLKAGPSSERNFGIYDSTGSPVYGLNFNGINSQTGNRTWCIATNDASNASLALAINYACGQGHADCSPIQYGGVCYEPNTYKNHADYAFNAYYQASNMDARSCNFSGTAMLTQRDPSYGRCIFFARPVNSARTLWQELLAHQQAQFGLTLLLSFYLFVKL